MKQWRCKVCGNSNAHFSNTTDTNVDVPAWCNGVCNELTMHAFTEFKYARFIMENFPYFDRVMDYTPEMDDIHLDGIVEIDFNSGSIDDELNGDYRVVKVNYDIWHKHFWLEMV